MSNMLYDKLRQPSPGSSTATATQRPEASQPSPPGQTDVGAHHDDRATKDGPPAGGSPPDFSHQRAAVRAALSYVHEQQQAAVAAAAGLQGSSSLTLPNQRPAIPDSASPPDTSAAPTFPQLASDGQPSATAALSAADIPPMPSGWMAVPPPPPAHVTTAPAVPLYSGAPTNPAAQPQPLYQHPWVLGAGTSGVPSDQASPGPARAAVSPADLRTLSDDEDYVAFTAHSSSSADTDELMARAQDNNGTTSFG